MSLAAKIAKGAFYQIAGKFVGTLLGLAIIALMARYLGQTGFGYYTIIVSYLQFFGVLIDFGLQMTTAQLLARPGADQSKIFGNLLAVRLLSALVFIGLGSVIVWFLPYPNEVKIGVGIAALSFFFISLQSVLIGLYQKHLAMAEVALAEIWGRLVLLIGVWLTTLFDWGFYPIIIAVSFGSFVNFLILYFSSQNYVRYRLAWDKKILKEIWNVSWPLAITISLTLVYFRADAIILSFVRPASDVGIYGAAYKVLEILIQLPYLFLGLILPLLSQFYLTNRPLFDKIFQKSFDFLAILAVPMVMGTWFLSEKIMAFIAGPEFAIAGQPLNILIVATGMIYFGALAGYTIVACGLQKKMISFYLFDAIFSLVAYLIFIPLYGYLAAAALTVATEAIIAFSSCWLLWRRLQLLPKWQVFGKAILASAVMCAVLWLLPNQSLLTLITLAVLIYFVMLYLLRGFDRQYLQDIITRSKI